MIVSVIVPPGWVVENYQEALEHVYQASCLIEDTAISTPDLELRRGRRRVVEGLDTMYGELSQLLGTLRELSVRGNR